LMPMNGRVNPSGAAFTHPMFQLYVMRLPTGTDGVHGRDGVTVGWLDVDVLDIDIVEVDVVDVDVVESDDVVDVDVVELDDVVDVDVVEPDDVEEGEVLELVLEVSVIIVEGLEEVDETAVDELDTAPRLV
jgi:hypothetical protein